MMRRMFDWFHAKDPEFQFLTGVTLLVFGLSMMAAVYTAMFHVTDLP